MPILWKQDALQAAHHYYKSQGKMTDKEIEERIRQLQLLEQNLQAFLMQKQTFQQQLIEIDSALEELKDAKQAYKIIGSVMVESKKEGLVNELTEKKEKTELRIKTMEKQEEKTRERAKELQKEVLGKIKKE